MNDIENQHDVDQQSRRLVHRHLLIGWCSLCGFATLGIWLEAMHAFKINWYLDDGYSTRRLMWTLGHAHGVLLSLIQIAMAATIAILPGVTTARLVASGTMIGATLLLPVGFFLGGVFVYGGDPGLGIWLVPVGAFLLIAALVLISIDTFGHLRTVSAAGPEAIE